MKGKLRLAALFFVTMMIVWIIWYAIDGELTLKNILFSGIVGIFTSLFYTLFFYSRISQKLHSKTVKTPKYTPQQIKDWFDKNNFEFYASDGDKLFFMSKNKWHKFFFTGAEKIEVSFNEEQIVIKGYTNLLKKLNLDKLQ